MNGSFFGLILDGVILGCGFYAIWLYIEMKRTGKIRQNLLMPKNLPVNRCRDVPGYIQFIGPRILTFGAVTLVCGIVFMSQDLGTSYNPAIAVGALVVFLVSSFWYVREIKKSVKKFW